jgi:hypothetical protein
MGNPTQRIDESPVGQAAEAPDIAPVPAASDDATQAAVDAALARFAAEHGIEPPAPKTSALDTLGELAGDAEHTSFGQKVLALAEKGIEEADLISETPAVRAIAAIVGELASKLA